MNKVMTLALPTLAIALVAFADVDHAWRFDASARTASVTAPVQATGQATSSWQNGYWSETGVRGLVTPGLLVIFR